MSNADNIMNLLPYDGSALYYARIMTDKDADDCFQSLLASIAWQHEEAIIYGKRIVTKRKVAWYGNVPYNYTYSGVSKQALPWTNELLSLKKLIEERAAETFNSCLLNLYHNGEEGMGWHSDNEVSIKKESAIASVSFGVNRKFSFRHKVTKDIISLVLENGSLLVMKGVVQTHWHHSLPKAIRIKEPRINLTFRSMKE